MAKVFCLFLVILLAGQASAQEDSSKHLFKPGTLVGKYYGTYDTSARKMVEAPETKMATNIQQSSPAGQKAMDRNGVSQMPRFQVNQNFDPIEVSGTEKVGGINVSDNARQGNLSDKTLSNRAPLQVNQNYDPIEVSGTTMATQLDMATSNPNESIGTSSISERPGLKVNKPAIINTPPPVKTSSPYRDTRLGSSSPMYDTYRSNDNGAGSITTNPNKSIGSVSVSPVPGPENPSSIVNKPEIYRDTRLGSSSPLYNTYRLNDDGAGSVTTSPKTPGSSISFSGGENVNQNVPVSNSGTFRTSRLGSSSPDYSTYQTNDNGAGAITTNPNKSGGGAPLPTTAIPIQPEQTSSDTTSSVKPQIRTAEKRSDNTNK